MRRLLQAGAPCPGSHSDVSYEANGQGGMQGDTGEMRGSGTRLRERTGPSPLLLMPPSQSQLLCHGSVCMGGRDTVSALFLEMQSNTFLWKKIYRHGELYIQ